ncbi:MAG: isoleucine--tRNA ligase [Candidatus Omnitrophota bacterium]
MNERKPGYKETLNLPRTDFPMKANLPQREPETIKKWSGMDVYGKITARRKPSGKSFILHDGPPYANGHIHMGHVLNKTLKDIYIKYFTMKGFFAPYVPGWDCHGLPVEHQLFKELNITKHDIGQVEFRKKAYKYAMKFVRIQAEEFKRLGVFGAWDDPYLTLTKDYEADILLVLADLYEKGYIYKDLKPVNWCGPCETALAEAEVEYEEKNSPSIFVKFPAQRQMDGRDIFFVIWTTTPWTLVSNAAVALHPDFEYSFVTAGDEVWILETGRIPVVMEKAGIREYGIVSVKSGGRIVEEFKTARHPFLDRDSVLVLADYVTKEDGSGCVHTAPGHGQDDFITGKKYGLPVIMPVDDTGRFTRLAGEFEGAKVLEANSRIIDKLRSVNALISAGSITHSYPHCWRCKNPIIFRATEQWFMSMDYMDLRRNMVRAIENDVEWIPAGGKDRISAMVSTRPDWCLSRQRYWGVPIPAFKCVSCGESFTSTAVINKVSSLTRQNGADVWFEKPVEELIGRETVCAKCGGKEFKKEDNILDVWFDSGVSHKAVLDARPELSFPADLYLEGSDQHRGWFQAALITSMASKGRPPYRKVLTHGFVVDGEGKKMSKSIGNVISPEDIMRKYGADILRLWVASSDYEGDIKLSSEILERLADGYRKIRNTFRFLLSNLYDFTPESDLLGPEALSLTDRWMLSRLYSLLKEINEYYEKWELHKVYRAVYNFCVFEVSSFYLDVSKDILYISARDSKERRSVQTVLFRILGILLRTIAPILCFTAEEAWGYYSFSGREESVHMSAWPDIENDMRGWEDPELDRRWKDILEIRESVMKFLELKRQDGLIGSSLEASIAIYSGDSAMMGFIKENIIFFPALFKVSQADSLDMESDGMMDVPGYPLKIGINKARGAKCQRCWNFSETVGSSNEHSDLCDRCYNIITERSRSDGK